MSNTIPFELNGAEYIADVVSAKLGGANKMEYFIKINGDDALFVNFIKSDAGVIIDNASPDVNDDMKAALQKALLQDLDTVKNNG